VSAIRWASRPRAAGHVVFQVARNRELAVVGRRDGGPRLARNQGERVARRGVSPYLPRSARGTAVRA
jgi:hypothetical protein